MGGKDEPSNFVLLCHRCHIDNPNLSDPEIMWDWIRAYGVSFYDTFWSILGAKEYEFIYNKSIENEIIDLGINIDEKLKDFIEINIKELINETSYHYGHPYLNTATYAGLYRMLIKRIANAYGKELPPFDNNRKRKFMGL